MSWCAFWLKNEPTSEMMEWLGEHTRSRYKFRDATHALTFKSYHMLKFKAERDAVLFMLRWNELIDHNGSAYRRKWRSALQDLFTIERKLLAETAAEAKAPEPHFRYTSRTIRHCSYCNRRYSRNRIYSHIIDVHNINPFEHTDPPQAANGMTQDSIDFYLARGRWKPSPMLWLL